LNDRTAGPSECRLKAHDLVTAALAILFALFSLAWPDTGIESLFDASFDRGFLMAAVYLAIALLALLFPLIESVLARLGSGIARIAGFLHTYYPEAFISLFFTDAILLSARAMGGYSHDDLFVRADQAIFGCQPSRELARALGSQAWINELMFGSYFAYFAFMALTIWIPYFKGDRREGERQMFVVAAVMAMACVWYVFFRVQGPKYWLPDLRAAWYESFEGGLFVRLFQNSLARATLSGAAFPSTHVILTLTTLGLAYRNDKRFFALYLPVACLILLATVYIRAHYATDALGGILVAATLSPLCYKLGGKAELLASKLSGYLPPSLRAAD
jgi:membrane-associated phospholipid phosphatase